MSKVMGIASIGGSIANVALLHHFLEGIVSVIALTIFSAMMGTLFLASACYAFYITLLNAGVSEETALLMITFGFAVLTGTFAALTVWRFKKMKSVPYNIVSNDLAPVKKAASVVQAFVSGFLKRPAAVKHSL